MMEEEAGSEEYMEEDMRISKTEKENWEEPIY
jgi:hypothetical protein